MAKSVTLKDTDGTSIYPVTDIALVNNGIHADPIAATTDAAYITTGMIQNGAVTSDKINWTTMVEVLNVGTETTTANGNITLSIKKTEAIPLAAVTDATNAVPTFYTWNGQDYWVLHLVQVSSSAPVASSSITGIKVYYLKLS